MNFKIVALLLALSVPAFAAGPSAYGVQGTISAAGAIGDCATSAVGGASASSKAVALQFAPSAFLSGSISAGGVPAAFNSALYDIRGDFVGTFGLGTSLDGLTWKFAGATVTSSVTNFGILSTLNTVPSTGEFVLPFGAKWACVFAKTISSGTATVVMEPTASHVTQLIATNGDIGELVDSDAVGRLRVVAAAPQVLGAYRINVTTGSYSGLGAGSILISLRYSGTATSLAIVTRVRCYVTTSTASTAAGRVDRALFIVRGFTASDTGGTAVSLASPAAKLRTSQAATAMVDLRVQSSAISAGTGTQDANPVEVMAKEATATEPVGLMLPAPGADTDLFIYNAGQNYPIVLAKDEGLRITIPTAMPTSIVNKTSCTFEWYEPSGTALSTPLFN